ncbi:MAG: ATP-binding cassette domain-containing protein [Desulfovibrionaceae bacterium]|nr:ATP-binding cassette domain-containing protein [Desulfovibrionaceae bacterium]
MKITLHEISKAYGGRDLFVNFSLDIEDGMHLCVCGPNGMGKSTLLRLIAGEEVPDAGRVLLPSGCRLGYVEQEFSEEALQTPLLTYVLDVVHDWNEFWEDWEKASASNDEEQLKVLMHRQSELEASVGYNPEQRAKTVLSGLGFSEEKWHRSLGQLSGGWRERAKLARVLTAGADILLLDEPTNHLDIDAVEWLEDFLKSFQGALVFVAHDRVFMDNIGSHVLYLGGGKPIFRKANYSQFLHLQEEYEVQRERERKALQDDLSKKMAFVDRFRYKATKARQAGSRLKQVKKLEKELEGYRPEPKRKELKFSWPEPPHAEKVLFHAIDLGFHFPDGKSMWPALNFTVFSGQRIALVGHNGCGKSTLIKILAERLTQTGGILQRSTSARMGYYAQHQMELLRPGYTVLAQMRSMCDPHTTEEELMSVLGLFLLGQNFFDRQVDSLSGGEKCRLVLASLFLQRCNLLLLDEPTNHLDLESREALANALSHYKGTLVMVAHDRWLLQETGCSIWSLDETGLAEHESFAAYDAARHAAEAAPEPVEAPAAAQASAAATAADGARQNLSRDEMKRLKREQAEARNALSKKLKPLREKYAALEKQLDDAMNEEQETEQKLADPETYADKELSGRLLARYNELKDLCDRLVEDLDALESRISALEQENAQ